MPGQSRSALIPAVVKSHREGRRQGGLDAETKKLVDDVVAKAK